MTGYTVPLCASTRQTLFNAANTAFGMIASSSISTTEAHAKQNSGVAGTFSNIAVKVFSNARTSASTLKSRKNGADGNQSASIGSTATGQFTDATHSDSIAVNDDFNIEWLNGANNAQSVVLGNMTSLFATASGAAFFLGMYGDQTHSTSTASQKTFYMLVGNAHALAVGYATDTDLHVLQKLRGTDTLSYGRVNVTTNGRGTATVFGTHKQGGADGNVAISATASTTGVFLDTTHSDAVSAGDNWESYSSTGTGAGSIVWAPVSFMGQSAAGKADYGCSSQDTTGSLGAGALFIPVIGDLLASITTTETNAALVWPAAGSVTNFRVTFVQNTGNANAITCSLVKNGSTGNNSLSVPSNTTGFFEDTTHTDQTAISDTLSAGFTAKAAGTVSVNYIGFSFVPGTPGTGSADIGTVTLTAPTVEADIKGSGSADFGTITLSAPIAEADIKAIGNAIFGTITLSAPTAEADIKAEADADIGTITLTAPQIAALVEAEGDADIGVIALTAPTVTAQIKVSADIGTIDLDPPHARAHVHTGPTDARATQGVRLTLTVGDGDARVTQAARLTAAEVTANARATQAARLVAAQVEVQPRVTQTVRLTIAPAIPCATQWAQCWQIRRRDGVILRFTSLDEDFEWGGQVYDSCDSLNPSAAESASTVGQVGNIELVGVISSMKISESDLYGGLYDDAFVEVWEVPYVDTAGEVPRRLAAGWTGNLTHSANSFNMEVIGPGARLSQQALTQAVTPTCRWVFGDPGTCTFDIEARKKPSFVLRATDRGKFTAAISESSSGAGDFSGEVFTDGSGSSDGVTDDGLQWANGKVRWTSGRNLSQVCEVKTVDFDTGEIVLWALPAFLPQPGDAFDLLPGCDQSADTCKNVYRNYLNFGGFRDVPGQDSIQQTPDAKY